MCGASATSCYISPDVLEKTLSAPLLHMVGHNSVVRSSAFLTALLGSEGTVQQPTTGAEFDEIMNRERRALTSLS